LFFYALFIAAFTASLIFSYADRTVRRGRRVLQSKKNHRAFLFIRRRWLLLRSSALISKLAPLVTICPSSLHFSCDYSKWFIIDVLTASIAKRKYKKR